MRVAHPLALRRGMRVGPWKVLAPLGSGSFGTVLQVEQAGQRYALKLALHGPGSEDLNRTDGRATRELACLLQAVHPNVVRVWAHGRWPDARTGYHYVVMDHVEGATLGGWVRRERPSARRVARLFARLARALDALHARNVFHRDLKPSNILVRAEDEEPVLVDFGSADHDRSLPLTEGPLPPGTPHYRSPEALRFQREHYATPGAHYPFRATDDLYALGVTLHEVLAGEPAFSPTLPREVLAEHIETRLPPAPSQVNPRVPPALDAIARRLMHKRPEARFPSGEALHAALEEALQAAGPEWDEPLRPPRPPEPPRPGPRTAPRLPTWSLSGIAALLALWAWSAVEPPEKPVAAAPTAQQQLPRRGVPCEPLALQAMTEVLKASRGERWDGRYPLEATLQLSYHQDSATGEVLEGGLEPGPIVSIVRGPNALPHGTVLYGWVWVDGDAVEIQYTEGSIEGLSGQRAVRIPLCARVGTVARRTLLTREGSTRDGPRFSRTDAYVVVDRW